MLVYKDKETRTLFRTNYIDHFGRVMFSPRGLVPFSQVEQVNVTREEYEFIPESNYRKVK